MKNICKWCAHLCGGARYSEDGTRCVLFDCPLDKPLDNAMWQRVVRKAQQRYKAEALAREVNAVLAPEKE